MDYETWLKGLEHYKNYCKETGHQTTLTDIIVISCAAASVNPITIPKPKTKTREELLKELNNPAQAIMCSHEVSLNAINFGCPCNNSDTFSIK